MSEQSPEEKVKRKKAEYVLKGGLAHYENMTIEMAKDVVWALDGVSSQQAQVKEWERKWAFLKEKFPGEVAHFMDKMEVGL